MTDEIWQALAENDEVKNNKLENEWSYINSKTTKMIENMRVC